MIDYFTLAGATLLASQIKVYWARRGYDVATWLECEERHTGITDPRVERTYFVRSDLVNGMPQRVVAEAA